MVFKSFSGPSEFVLIFNILMRLMQKTLLIGYLQQNGIIHLVVYLKKGIILLECRQCLVHSMWSTIGHCVQYIGIISANYPRVFLDSFSVEQPIGTGKLVWRTYDWSECRRKISKRTPINYVYWSYFCINRIKTLIFNLKSSEPLEFFRRVKFI